MKYMVNLHISMTLRSVMSEDSEAVLFIVFLPDDFHEYNGVII